MTNNYKQEEKILRKILQNHVKPTHANTDVKLEIFYKNKKLKNLIIKNNSQPNTDDANVVYQFSCNETGCTSSYIGYTTNAIKDRMRQHTYNGSIKDHILSIHEKTVNLQSVLENTKIISRKPTKQELLINEALLIKENKPEINIQSHSFTNILKIF